MKKILFVCHGNICRSPMAEFIFKDMVRKAGLEKDFLIESAATSTEEIGNDIHYKAMEKLRQKGIPVEKHTARQITEKDYENYDFIIGMDIKNLFYMQRKWGKDNADKIRLLLSYTGRDKDIADPWYTGNFDATYNDISEGCKAFLDKVK